MLYVIRDGIIHFSNVVKMNKKIYDSQKRQQQEMKNGNNEAMNRQTARDLFKLALLQFSMNLGYSEIEMKIQKIKFPLIILQK
ncbi:unnamed protein product (macronuclear) [Paramecium tetraurelia]|uniref:Uncharacterized protein n=1 Tax=Paramecium tetraurelia TaxID=5888 RepID=A0CU62_PARTE|nr:uncharacterized protein GSPATT00010528001 [Paramecium tetraurelia]CAK74329.1 unnamed protein product [Paramecium tetraurelia]|eukprot:XP_001441726.1 hypothetical protein (macronuclear) [Paramecium tetraurelia strain d4-2]